MRKKIIFSICLIGVLFLASCGKQETVKKQPTEAKWQKGETVVIGIDDSFVPMGFRNENDQIIGFDIDLAKKVFETEKIHYVFQPINWAMKETELSNGTIDVIWNGYSATPEREKVVAFSKPYLKNRQVLVTLSKSHIQSFKAMKGKKLGVQEGSSGESLVLENPHVLLDWVAGKEATTYDTFTNSFLDLKFGRIDGLIIDQVFADYYLSHDEKKTSYTMIKGDLPEEDFVIGVRKNDRELLDIINAGLEETYRNQQSKKISEKWFNEDRIVPPI